MEDNIVKVEFNVWASSPDAGAEISKAIGQIIDWYGQKGIKVTAEKMMEAIQKWNGNAIIRQGMMKYLK